MIVTVWWTTNGGCFLRYGPTTVFMAAASPSWTATTATSTGVAIPMNLKEIERSVWNVVEGFGNVEHHIFFVISRMLCKWKNVDDRQFLHIFLPPKSRRWGIFMHQYTHQRARWHGFENAFLCKLRSFLSWQWRGYVDFHFAIRGRGGEDDRKSREMVPRKDNIDWIIDELKN